MFRGLRRLFSQSDNLSSESREFIQTLAPTHIWLLVVGLRGIPVMPPLGDPAAFEIAANHRIDVAEIGDDDSVWPFNYDQGGTRILPFFNTKDLALAFQRNSGLDVKLLQVFQPYSLLAGFVATPENEVFELILNPQTANERKLNKGERLLLRSLSEPT